MVYVITYPAVKPGQRNSKWWFRGAAFTVGAVLAGATLGSGLGAVGSLFGDGPRAIATLVLGSIGIFAGARELAGRTFGLKQFNRETSRRRRPQPLLWALYNGVALGAGFRTRLGFVIWYAVPGASIASGSWLAGAIVYGSYGAARGLAPWLLLAHGHLSGFAARDLLLRQRGLASSVSALALITLCATVIGRTASSFVS